MEIDLQKGREAARTLHAAFQNREFHGQSAAPEDMVPEGVIPGSREHLLFITLTLAIGHQRDTVDHWNSSRLTYRNRTTRYLFEPAELRKVPFRKITRDLRKCKLSRHPVRDAQIWATIATALFHRYNSDPRSLLAAGGYRADRILQVLQESSHRRGRKEQWDFPSLRDPGTGPRWIRMLRDNLGYDLANMERVPIPVDLHIARATLALGVVKGRYEGPLQHLSETIGEAWFKSVKGLTRPDGLPMIALDIEEPLRCLSLHGCRARDESGLCAEKQSCPCGNYCIPGLIEIDTARDYIKVVTEG